MEELGLAGLQEMLQLFPGGMPPDLLELLLQGSPPAGSLAGSSWFLAHEQAHGGMALAPGQPQSPKLAHLGFSLRPCPRQQTAHSLQHA